MLAQNFRSVYELHKWKCDNIHIPYDNWSFGGVIFIIFCIKSLLMKIKYQQQQKHAKREMWYINVNGVRLTAHVSQSLDYLFGMLLVAIDYI